MKRIWIILSVLVLAALACQAAAQTPAPPTLPSTPQAETLLLPQVNIVEPIAQEGTLAALYEQALPGVVAIRVVTDGGGGLGSGFVYDSQGHVVTNFHVVEGATQVEVDFSSGYKTYGTVIGKRNPPLLA